MAIAVECLFFLPISRFSSKDFFVLYVHVRMFERKCMHVCTYMLINV